MRVVRVPKTVDKDAVDREKLQEKMSALEERHGKLLPRVFQGMDGKPLEHKTGQLRFLQFNMLAQGLSSAPDYGGFKKSVEAGKEALNFDGFRKFRVLQEILRNEADVIAVQEMDHFGDFFLPAMEHYGYTGLFHPKTNSPTLEFGSGNFSDGCCLFWNKAKLQHQETYELNYDSGKLGVIWSQGALIVRLKMGSTSLLVATTHLKSKPPHENRRTKSIKQLLQLLEKKKQPQDHIVIMGDFNTDPSGPGLHTYKTVINHSLSFRSAYAGHLGKEEAEYTTCKMRKTEKKHTIDYVFLQPSMEVTAVLEIPPVESLPACKLPCFAYPSDHLSIGCDVKFKTN